MKKTYAHHAPAPDSVAKIKELRQSFSDLHELVQQLTPTSREQAVSLTQLETAAMWAIKALVVNDPQSEVEAG